MGTQAEPESETTEGTEEIVDELTGEELFEIPEDLKDEPDTAAPAGADADPKGPPAETATSGTPRGPDGKFVKKEDAPAAPAGQPPEGAPAADAPQPPAQSATGQPAAVAEEPVLAPELEFSFRADGKTIPFPGSKVTDEGIFIPREYMAQVQRTLSRGVVYEGSFKEKLQQANNRVAEVEGRVHREVEESKHLLSFFADLFERGPAAVQDWLDEFGQNRPRLEADARVAYAEALDKRRETPVRPEPVQLEGVEEDDFLANVDQDQLMTELGNVLGQNIRAVIVEAGIRGLTPADVTRIHKAIVDDPDELQRYFAVATEDIPEMEAAKGDILVRRQPLTKRLQYEASIVSDARKSVSAAVKADAENKRTQGGGAPPPTAAVAGAGVSKKKEVKIPTTREELDAYMDAED